MTKDHNTEQAVSDIIREALEIGLDAAREVAAETHRALAGYKPLEHAAVDADVQKIEQAIAALSQVRGKALEPVAVPDGWKIVPDYKVGMSVKFCGDEYKIFAYRDRPGTFDICHPTDNHRDRWVNVPPESLEPLAAAPQVSQPIDAGAIWEQAICEVEERIKLAEVRPNQIPGLFQILRRNVEAKLLAAAPQVAQEEGAREQRRFDALCAMQTWPEDLHDETSRLVMAFASAMAGKLATAQRKYGYSNGWTSPDWMDQCRADLLKHVAKGDPRDVANYCAFLWFHNEKTAAPQSDAQPSSEKDAEYVDIDALRRISHELRTYNPAGDEYKGAHIHKVWAKEIDRAIAKEQGR